MEKKGSHIIKIGKHLHPHPPPPIKNLILRVFDLPSWEMDCLTGTKISDLMAKQLSNAMEVVRDNKSLLVKFYSENGVILRIDLRFIGDVPSVFVCCS